MSEMKFLDDRYLLIYPDPATTVVLLSISINLVWTFQEHYAHDSSGLKISL
jgi:hypothetical protein